MVFKQEHAKFELGKGKTIARLKKGSILFEVIVDMDEALRFKKGETNFLDIEGDRIFTNVRKGEVPTKNELDISFGTSDALEVGKIIVKEGEVLIDQTHRDEEKEKKLKQIVDFLSKNAIDPQVNRPISPERIRSALEEAHVQIKNVPIENQIPDILNKISNIMPIKIETRKIKITVPAVQTGKVYGLITQYKEKENWLADGSLEVVLNIPAGILIEFYDKLNSATHGSAVTSEINE